MANAQFICDNIECSNVILFKVSFLSYHRDYLMRWFKAGLCMGLCDVEIHQHKTKQSIDYILIWVRENPAPAYILRPQSQKWEIIDNIRHNNLGSYTSLEVALNHIRPVMPHHHCG